MLLKTDDGKIIAGVEYLRYKVTKEKRETGAMCIASCQQQCSQPQKKTYIADNYWFTFLSDTNTKQKVAGVITMGMRYNQKQTINITKQ